jgi:alpha-ketoglutarate-dependent taurine dioxygenase
MVITASAPRSTADGGGPFDLENPEAYQEWMQIKLERYPQRVEDLIVEVRDPRALTAAEREALNARCRRANMAIYTCRQARPPIDKDAVRALGAQLGLHRLDRNPCADEDHISTVRVARKQRRHDYIPYTNRPLRWHTDGYYNAADATIRAFLMHCVQDAASGGENALLDPEILYLLLRNENPALVAALMQPDAMTIPANTVDGREIRAAQSGPVFSIDPTDATLHLRYTARRHSIAWKSDAVTRAAVRRLEELIESNPYVFRYRLRPGDGIVCNNVLHNRSGFEDSATGPQQRVLYRARYYDRIEGTRVDDVLERGKRRALAQ